jgi:hypothetical protein
VSTEAEPFVVGRPTNNVIGLDVDADGTFVSVRELLNRAKAELRSYLAGFRVAARQPSSSLGCRHTVQQWGNNTLLWSQLHVVQL